ncbi:hypothetical protein SH661x_002322 [Planctomicrobium sp. SH661]|uniref:hypothetical protein n=1 Tax=Planctomicrobium sp. SH661 TaxID=3448124 RepID=UPI003F5B83DE
MSVESCKRNPGDQSGGEDTCTEGWIVTVNNKNDHPLSFVGGLQASGALPYRGAGHPINPFFRATGLKYQRWNGNSLRQWHITCEYKMVFSEKDEDAAERESTPNPLERRPKVTKSYDRAEIPCFEDRDGNAILNAAGDAFLDPVVRPKSCPVWNVQINVAASPGWMDSLADKTNSDTFEIRGRSYPAGTLLFEPGDESDIQTENGVEFITVSFKLLVDMEGWKDKRIENGLNEMVDIGGGDKIKRKIKLPLKDEEGNELEYDDALRDFVSDPQMLDEDGYLIENPTHTTAVFKETEIYEEESFSSALPDLSGS